MKNTTLQFLTVCGSLLAIPITAHAQDPFAANPEAKADAKAESIQIIYEVFSLPLTEAAGLLRAGPTDSEFYQKMVEGVRAQKITQEVFLMGRGLPGQRTTIEQVSEHIYNTEVEPPELPNQVAGGAGLKQDAKGNITPADFPVTPAMPTAFDTRKVGDSLELEVQMDANGVNGEYRISAWTVSLIKRDSYGQGMSKTEMPRFANQSIKSGISFTIGKPFFLGTISPPEELQPDKDEDRVWFAFIEAKVIAQ